MDCSRHQHGSLGITDLVRLCSSILLAATSFEGAVLPAAADCDTANLAEASTAAAYSRNLAASWCQPCPARARICK